MPPLNQDSFYIGPWLLIIGAIIIIAFLAFIIIWSVRAHKNQVYAGREEMIGKTAVVDIALRPKGVVLVEGERWTAVSEEGHIKPQEEVVITKLQGLKLYVVKKH